MRRSAAGEAGVGVGVRDGVSVREEWLRLGKALAASRIAEVQVGPGLPGEYSLQLV